MHILFICRKLKIFLEAVSKRTYPDTLLIIYDRCFSLPNLIVYREFTFTFFSSPAFWPACTVFQGTQHSENIHDIFESRTIILSDL